jgi:nucleoid DNA-binding protein
MRETLSSLAQPNKGEQQSVVDRAMQFGFSTLMGTVMGRTDLSELDVEKIMGQIQSARDKLMHGAEKATSNFSPIKADVENYLLNSYAWHFNRETLDTEFREVLYDPEADPSAIRHELERLHRGDFVNLLTQRGDLPAARVAEIADQLEVIRSTVLSTVQQGAEQHESTELRNRIENYFRSASKEELNSDAIEREVSSLLEDSDADYDALKTRLSPLDRDTLVQLLNQRQDLAPEEINSIVNRFESTRDRVLNTSQENHNRIRSEAEALRVRVESYLRNTNKSELNPEGIKRDFRLLLDDPQAGASALRTRLSHFDRATLVQLLGQRQDLTPEEADRIVNQLEEVRHNILHAPQAALSRAKDQVDSVTMTLENYLRNTNLSELDPEGIRSDLNALLNDPKTGASRLGRRLSQVDRQTIVTLLAQRPDLTEEQVNRVVDQVQASIRSIIRSPRRLASRTQHRVQDFQSTFENYLRNTHKEELNPDGIKRDLTILLRDPRTGFGLLSDRLSHMDRATMISLLAQRPDMTEEEASRVVDQVLSVRDQFTAQIQAIQTRIQSVIDGILGRIRSYLNSMERPELNYDGISDDLRTLFHDPKAGFDALRDRLGSFNRDTLVALLSSRDDISQADANHLIDRVENTRNTVLRRAERLQTEAQMRLEEVKRQAKKQAEETRKAAETAAWWLFGTALVSAGAAALAGAIAVGL